MKVRLILLGIVAGLVLPLAAANAGAVFDSGLNRAGSGADVARGAAPAQNFGRNEDEGNRHDKCDKDGKDGKDGKGDWGDKCRCRDRDDKGDKCEKSPSKP